MSSAKVAGATAVRILVGLEHGEWREKDTDVENEAWLFFRLQAR